jgi:hypothetical protein
MLGCFVTCIFSKILCKCLIIFVSFTFSRKKLRVVQPTVHFSSKSFYSTECAIKIIQVTTKIRFIKVIAETYYFHPL